MLKSNNILICGNVATGKTTLAQNLIINNYKDGNTIIIIDCYNEYESLFKLSNTELGLNNINIVNLSIDGIPKNKIKKEKINILRINDTDVSQLYFDTSTDFVKKIISCVSSFASNLYNKKSKKTIVVIDGFYISEYNSIKEQMNFNYLNYICIGQMIKDTMMKGFDMLLIFKTNLSHNIYIDISCEFAIPLYILKLINIFKIGEYAEITKNNIKICVNH